MSKWESVPDAGVTAVRVEVPGGWIYRISGEVVFVPKPGHEVEVDLPPGSLLNGPEPIKMPADLDAVDDLIAVVNEFLCTVERYDPNGLLLQDCNAVDDAIGKVEEPELPWPPEASKEHLVARAAASFKKFFEGKYAGETIQCQYIKALFEAVEEWQPKGCTQAEWDAYMKRHTESPIRRLEELSEAPVG